MSTTLTPINAHLQTHPKGRRFSPAERDAAFLVYMGVGRQNMVKTAQLTGVARNTLMDWARQDDWERRIDKTGSAASDVVAVAYAFLPHLFKLGMDRAMRILDDDEGNQNAQVKLFLEVAGMYGMIAPKQSVSVVQHLSGNPEQAVVSMKDLIGMEPDQLAAWDGANEEQEEEGETDGTA